MKYFCCPCWTSGLAEPVSQSVLTKSSQSLTYSPVIILRLSSAHQPGHVNVSQNLHPPARVRNICTNNSTFINSSYHSRFVLNVGDDFLGCSRSAKLISEVFCLPTSYRKEVPPKSKLRNISWYVWVGYWEDNFTANGPINVFFKLPITEVSNVDDRTRVRFTSYIEHLSNYIVINWLYLAYNWRL